MRTFFGSLIFLAIIGVQVAATLSNNEFYPFSPYRMFSKYWSRQDVMETVRLVGADGRTWTPWQALPIPFFQANALMYRFFLDPSPAAAKATLCALMSRRLPPPIQVQDVQSIYNGAQPREIAHSTVYVCSVRKSDI